jgi:hypothetical protein
MNADRFSSPPLTPRPFYRSRLFWLGLPGLIFLMWVWLGMRSYLGWAQKGYPSILVLAGTESGTYHLAWHRRLSPAIQFTSTGLKTVTATQEPAPLFPAAFGYQSDESLGIRRSTEIRIAHWLAVAIYLALWLTACGLWQRRKRLVLENHAPPSAPPGSSSVISA